MNIVKTTSNKDYGGGETVKVLLSVIQSDNDEIAFAYERLRSTQYDMIRLDTLQ